MMAGAQAVHRTLVQFMNVFNETKEEQQLQRHPGGEANRDTAPAAAGSWACHQHIEVLPHNLPARL